MGPATKDKLLELPDFGYVYSDPEFSWQDAVAPTALSFVNSVELEKYNNSLFVGDCNYGNLYKFELNENRDGFIFNTPALSDNVVNTNESMDEIVFGTDFGCITDIEMGPDGFLYIVSLSEGAIYRIIPKAMAMDKVSPTSRVFPIEYVIYGIVSALVIAGIIYLAKSRKK
jgi:glucose/arabinose dehydrogenase